MRTRQKHNTVQQLQCAARYIRTALAARLIEIGLYPGQETLLLMLSEEDGQSPGRLARNLCVKPPTVTKMITRLQAQGFVAKKASDNDLRQAFVFLTDNGHSVIQSIEKAIKKTEKDIFSGFNSDDQRDFIFQLNRIVSNLNCSIGHATSLESFDIGEEVSHLH